MTRRLISSGSTFEQEIGFSRAVVDGDWVFVSGTTGFDYASMTIPDGLVEQTEQCLRNIEAALAEAGSSLRDVVRVVYVLPDAAEFRQCWPTLRQHFGEVRPAAMMISAGLADPRMRIEIEVTARVKNTAAGFSSAHDRIAAVLGRITDAWRNGTPELMAPAIDEQIVIVFPGFAGRLRGRAAFIESFRQFAREARVLSYQQGTLDIDCVGEVAVAQYPFEMVYQREGADWRSTGWDVWVFEHRGADWIAVWRTMQGVAEAPATPGSAAG